MNEKGWNVMKRKIAKGLMAASVLICCLFLVKEVFAGRFFSAVRNRSGIGKHTAACRQQPVGFIGTDGCKNHRGSAE